MTSHATLRLKERTSLDEEALKRLLHRSFCVVVGIEPNTSRLHKLIYSSNDKAHFVAIQDVLTEEVITILPLDYHQNLAWEIPQKRLRQAIFRADPELHKSLFGHTTDPLPGLKSPIVLVLNSIGMDSVKKRCGSYRFNDVPAEATDALADPEFIETLLKRLRDRKIELSMIEEILLLDEEQNLHLKLTWNELSDFTSD